MATNGEFLLQAVYAPVPPWEEAAAAWRSLHTLDDAQPLDDDAPYRELDVESDARSTPTVEAHLSRQAAVREVIQQNFDAEIRAGVLESLRRGSVPNIGSCVILCCTALPIAILFLAICGAHTILTLEGFLITCSLVGSRPTALSAWLLLSQVVAVVEVLCPSLLSPRRCKLAGRVAEEFLAPFASYGCELSTALKVVWCMFAHHLAKSAERKERLVEFMTLYPQIFIMELLLVKTCVNIFFSYVKKAAIQGRVWTARGAQAHGMDPSLIMESMQEVSYSRQLFADVSDLMDERPLSECCICLDGYVADGLSIIRTPCEHIMHKDCLKHWLQMSHFCPMCRGDLMSSERSSLL